MRCFDLYFLFLQDRFFEKKSLDQSLKTVILYLQYQLIVTYTGRLKNSFFEGHNPSPCLFSHPLSSPPFLIISYLLQQSSNQILSPAKFSSDPTSTNGTFFITFNLKLEEKQLILDILILVCINLFTPFLFPELN